ncbi:hypothetical protein [Vibrio panuliri]|uniref:TM2 domain-containing protein n=1 Tax=Vibrio panuliri TaxID=1381081 RepID=A0A1Q9HJ45_9VIBR|nr:hypothetical protein [Vibrio panuliri]KAB1454134.1 hypothetical protein F7O85_14655 [Vibrio panuliri]OLQ90331.1 hypothetical protein BIY22_04860 [Vibrio panuliri]OLQ93651.1 hypothetical protein BIY20_08395 [Vibrio panuliri]
MSLRESIEELEQKEEELRKRVNALPEAQKKAFYARQTKELKDPDTYASLNWFFLGGIHHCYLGKYSLFAIEFVLLIVSVIGLIMGNMYALIIIGLLVIYELPQLFYSQRIARQHNYNLSCAIYDDVRQS